jgi:glycine/D-amino acid oxidase-like deaminating enzyme
VISENTSPWLSQLKRSRPITKLAEDLDADVAVVGGGISGVATAYFLLRDTGVSVVLLERDEVASGATGHNGGQAVASFERIALELSEEFGEDLTRDGFRAIEGAWDLLQSMIEETGVDPGLQETATYIGYHRLKISEFCLKKRCSSAPGLS